MSLLGFCVSQGAFPLKYAKTTGREGGKSEKITERFLLLKGGLVVRFLSLKSCSSASTCVLLYRILSAVATLIVAMFLWKISQLHWTCVSDEARQITWLETLLCALGAVFSQGTYSVLLCMWLWVFSIAAALSPATSCTHCCVLILHSSFVSRAMNEKKTSPLDKSLQQEDCLMKTPNE